VKGNTFEVVERKGHYLWLKPLETKGKGMTPLGNIEGGLPHYRYGAIFSGREGKLFGIDVKAQEILENGVGIFKPNFEVLANGVKVRGIGVYCNEERVKLIGGNFEVGDIIKIEIKARLGT
ncbi:MAG: hypothetical protein PWP39_1751, partial [Pyrococcus sp.]|nr:hypothetical protein [Pyrococcus sp.]